MRRFTDGSRTVDAEIKKDGKDITLFAIDFYDYSEQQDLYFVNTRLHHIRRMLEQEEGLEIIWEEVKR